MKKLTYFTRIFLFFVLFLLPVLTKSQTSFVSQKQYKKGLIFLKNRQSFNGEKLVFKSGQLTFKDTKNSQLVTLPTTDLKYVKAQTGSYALECALVGGGLAALGIASAYVEAEGSPYIEVKEERIPILLGVGILGGAVIGAIFKKEKIVFNNNKFTADIFIKRENRMTNLGNYITSVGFKIQFLD